jgi:hypothetical protein
MRFLESLKNLLKKYQGLLIPDREKSSRNGLTPRYGKRNGQFSKAPKIIKSPINLGALQKIAHLTPASCGQATCRNASQPMRAERFGIFRGALRYKNKQ